MGTNWVSISDNKEEKQCNKNNRYKKTKLKDALFAPDKSTVINKGKVKRMHNMIILPYFRARKCSIQSVVPQMRLNAVAFHAHAKRQFRELSQPVDTQSQRQIRL